MSLCTDNTAPYRDSTCNLLAEGYWQPLHPGQDSAVALTATSLRVRSWNSTSAACSRGRASRAAACRGGSIAAALSCRIIGTAHVLENSWSDWLMQRVLSRVLYHKMGQQCPEQDQAAIDISKCAILSDERVLGLYASPLIISGRCRA